MTQDNGGPAFPTTKPLKSWGDENTGMTLRDYFATKAASDEIQEITRRSLSRSAQEILVGRKFPEQARQNAGIVEITDIQIAEVKFYSDVSAALRFMFADSMIEARK